jgi:hypothetical protein
MADKSYRPGSVRAVEVRILPNRGDVDLADLVVSSPQYRILRFTKDGGLEQLYDWATGSYDSDKGIILGTWNGALPKISGPGHYAMELRATVDTEVPRHLVTIDVEI